MDLLVTLEQAKKRLRIPYCEEDDDLRLMLEQAQALVIDFVRQRLSDATTWAATVDAWTEDSVPPQVTVAILLQFGELTRFRGDDVDLPHRDKGSLSPAVEACLWRLRDPAMA